MTGERITKVSDGDYVYTVNQTHEGKKVTKARAIPPRIRNIGGAKLFARMPRAERETLLADEVLDGREVYVFEVLATGGLVMTRHYMDKETGVRLRLVVERLKDHTTLTYSLTDLKLNLEFSDDHFTFVPPEGVKILDLTRRANRRSAPVDGS